MSKHKHKIIAGVVIAAVLVFAFWWGGGSDELHGFVIKTEPTAAVSPAPELSAPDITPAPTPSASLSAAVPAAPNAQSEAQKETQEETQEETAPIQYESAPPKTQTDVLEAEAETQSAEENKREMVCTLTVRCDTILENIERLKSEKQKLVPASGVILPLTRASFSEGETVFDVLLREMKKNKIHFDFEKTPAYNSVYIKGIGNLYEFDCGELSGWMYSVGGKIPGYSCSEYKLRAGDRIEVLYTCDLGKDVGI